MKLLRHCVYLFTSSISIACYNKAHKDAKKLTTPGASDGLDHKKLQLQNLQESKPIESWSSNFRTTISIAKEDLAQQFTTISAARINYKEVVESVDNLLAWRGVITTDQEVALIASAEHAFEMQSKNKVPPRSVRISTVQICNSYSLHIGPIFSFSVDFQSNPKTMTEVIVENESGRFAPENNPWRCFAIICKRQAPCFGLQQP